MLRPQRRGPLPDPLLRQLRLIYLAEVDSARELATLFRRTRWLPLRLALWDQRKETKRHIDRVVALLPAGIDGAALARMEPAAGADLDGAVTLPAAAIVAGPLREARSAVGLYAAGIAAAAERGLVHAARLLEQSLIEENHTVQRLAALAKAICSQ